MFVGSGVIGIGGSCRFSAFTNSCDICSCMKDFVVGGSFFIRKTKFQKIPLQRVSLDSCSSSPPFFRRYFAFWHSCLSERKHPSLTSYSRNSQLPPSDFAPFCRMNRYLERFSLPHTQPFAAVRQIACRIRTYGITLVRLHAFPFLPDNA